MSTTRCKPRHALWRAIVLGTVSLAVATSVEAQEPYFPESVFLPKNKDLNALVADMTAVHLKAMKEPSLWKLSRDDRDGEAYRFLWRATGEHPISIRITKKGEAMTVRVARHDGPPGLTAGRLSLDKSIKLGARQWETLVAGLQATPFWKAPVEVKESRGIADGDGFVIEGIKGGQYHIVDRAGSTAKESYKAFCRAMLVLADEPDALKAWDRFRQGEREHPGYRPDPPETEDRGDYTDLFKP